MFSFFQEKCIAKVEQNFSHRKYSSFKPNQNRLHYSKSGPNPKNRFGFGSGNGLGSGSVNQSSSTHSFAPVFATLWFDFELDKYAWHMYSSWMFAWIVASDTQHNRIQFISFVWVLGLCVDARALPLHCLWLFSFIWFRIFGMQNTNGSLLATFNSAYFVHYVSMTLHFTPFIIVYFYTKLNLRYEEMCLHSIIHLIFGKQRQNWFVFLLIRNVCANKHSK